MATNTTLAALSAACTEMGTLMSQQCVNRRLVTKSYEFVAVASRQGITKRRARPARPACRVKVLNHIGAALDALSKGGPDAAKLLG